MIWAVIGFGVLIGVALGLVGGGGGILAVPALVYGLGMPMSAAVPGSLVIVGASSAIAVVPRLRRDISWPLAIVLGGIGALTATGGAAVNRLLDQNVLLLIFAVIMIIAGVRMLLPNPETKRAGCLDDEGAMRWRACLPKAIGTGIVIGFLTGLLGVGGGFLIIPALVLILGVPMSTAVGTSLVIIVFNSAGGLLSHYSELSGQWPTTIIFTVSAMIASALASLLGRKIPDRFLTRGFATLILVLAIVIGTQSLMSL